MTTRTGSFAPSGRESSSATVRKWLLPPPDRTISEVPSASAAGATNAATSRTVARISQHGLLPALCRCPGDDPLEAGDPGDAQARCIDDRREKGRASSTVRTPVRPPGTPTSSSTFRRRIPRPSASSSRSTPATESTWVMTSGPSSIQHVRPATRIRPGRRSDWRPGSAGHRLSRSDASLPWGRDRDRPCPGLELVPPDLRRHRRLAVWCEADAGIIGPPRHDADVVLERVSPDDHRGQQEPPVEEVPARRSDLGHVQVPVDRR